MKKKSILLLLPFAAMALAGCGPTPTPPPSDPCESAVVQLNKTTLSLEVGASETLVASMSVEGCDLGDVTWSSDHPEIAKVENGKVTGVSAGTAVISANGASCTVTVTPKIDPPGPTTNYGTEDAPLTITQAAAILAEECVNDKDLTKQAITAIGEVKAIRKVYHYDDDIGPDCFELDLTDGASDIYVYRLHATAEVGANIAVSSTVKFVGFGKNFKGTLEIVDNGDVKCTALSAEKTSKTAVSISDVVGPAEVALNSSIAVSEVTLTVNYDDESKLEGQHPDSIDLDTTSAGEKTATVHYGELTGSFNVTVKNVESPNQFVDAYEAAAALESGKTTTESYNFKGIVVAKRGTEYYVQHEGYGLDVYNPSTAPAIGDFVEVNSTMKNYNGTLETGTINKIAILESEQELPAAAEVTSAEVLGNLKQNILANVAGTAKEDITTIDTSKDYTLALMVGTDEIPVFIKKAALATLKDKLVGVKAGDAISITGAVTGEFKGTKQVLVVDGSTINIPRPVSGVAFDEEAYSVLVGEKVTVKANVLPEDADDKVVSYSLANPSDGVEATIDAETGEITAGSVAGTVEVVATAHGDSTKTASVTLTISSAAIPVTGVTLDKETMTIEMKGEGPWTGSLTATVAPADATNKNYSFSSGDEEVATVTNEGLVTGLKEGECDITVTTEDGGKTAVCHVSVIPEQPIVKEGTYVIKHVVDETTYYLKENGTSSAPSAVTNADDATIFRFALVDGTLDTYTIKTLDGKYLYSTKSNDGVRVGGTEFSWIIEEGVSTLGGAFNIKQTSALDSSKSETARYLTLYNNSDFRTYNSATASNRKQNSDLEAVVVKEVDHIAVEQEPTKKSYYVGDTIDLTGLVVRAYYTDTTDEIIDNDKLIVSPKTFQAAAEERDITVTYQEKNAHFKVEVKVDDRTITSIKFADGCDMTKKEYEVGDDWDPKGLKVIAVRSDDSEFELADSDVTFTYNKATDAVAESMALNVTAHYKVDETTTLDSSAKEVTGIVVKAKEEVEGSLYTFDPAKKTTQAIDGTKFMQALVLEDGDEIITGASNLSYTYIGANGGSGDATWALDGCLKLGKGSGGYGSVTLALDSSILFTKVKVCVLGWADTCKLKVGDIEKEFSNKATKDNLTPVELEFNISSGESSLTIQSVYSSGNLAVLVTSIQFC